MKAIILCFIIAVASAVFTDVDESIDINAIMTNADQLKLYMDCFLDKGPCSKSATSYKKHIIEFNANACKDCDDKMKHIVEEFLLNVMTNYPIEMAKLKAKYDPTGVNLSKLAFAVSKYKK